MARKTPKIWVAATKRPTAPPVPAAEKQAIIAACEAFIRDVLKPRFLPAIKPSEWNYPIDLRGCWAGRRYRFIQRYRYGTADNTAGEFDAPYARLDWMGPDRFDIYWMRHTGQWWPLHADVTLAAALHIMETDGILFPYAALSQ